MSTTKTTDLILRIIAAGGNVVVDADKTTDLLVKIASAAAEHGTNVTITNAGKKTTDLLERIAKAGQGRVTFDLTK